MHNFLKNVASRIRGLYAIARTFKYELSSRKLVSAYLANNQTKKLHIGCGDNILPEWLNTDYYPKNRNIPHLDATKQYPFEDGTFDYIFSEHVIEHFAFAEGLSMLEQCNRVLISGGKIRLSTPNLRFLVDLYSEKKSALQEKYIQWASDQFVKNGIHSDTMVINNYFRRWGHTFIYDEKTLRFALEAAGFVDVYSCRINESADIALKNLENTERLPAGFLQLETFTLEARKP